MIVVFGSLVLDIVMATDGLPGPGETALTDGYRLLPGGKGANQALAAARAGGEVRFIGCRGNDAFGDRVVENLLNAAVDLNGVTTGNRPTACATVCVDRAGDNLIVVASGANLDVRARQLLNRPPGSGDVCLFQMEVPLAENWSAIAAAHEAGARTILNVAPFAPVPQHILSVLDVLVLNEAEAVALADNLAFDRQALDGLARHLADRFDLIAVITLGANGAIAADRDGLLTATALKLDTIDTVGAGDAFVGAFATAFTAGRPLADCLRHASVAGGLTCLIPGAQDGIPDGATIVRRLADVVISGS